MPKKENIENEKEPLTDIIDVDTLKILDGKVQELEEELNEKRKDKLIETADKQLLQKQDISEDIKETTFYLDFFMSISITLINPLLKKYNIDEITMKETHELAEALMSIASEKTLSTSGKIGKAISKVINLPKILKLITIAWHIVFPRLSKYLESKPKSEKIPGIK